MRSSDGSSVVCSSDLMPMSALVLGTDAPDIPPAWLGRDGRSYPLARRNEPAEVAGIARELAALRAMPPEAIAQQCGANAGRVLPRLAQCLPDIVGNWPGA